MNEHVKTIGAVILTAAISLAASYAVLCVITIATLDFP